MAQAGIAVGVGHRDGTASTVTATPKCAACGGEMLNRFPWYVCNNCTRKVYIPRF